MKLVTFQKDWADEFYVYGWKIFTDQEWLDFETLAKESPTFYMQFGTNEGWGEDYEMEGDEILEDLEVRDISDEEAIVIKAAFNSDEFGVFPDKECFANEQDD
jgi:hypothetical protein